MSKVMTVGNNVEVEYRENVNDIETQCSILTKTTSTRNVDVHERQMDINLAHLADPSFHLDKD